MNCLDSDGRSAGRPVNIVSACVINDDINDDITNEIIKIDWGSSLVFSESVY